MKQTKNALTMLLKAYKAVFTAAFTKGLASAVVLTAGLAVGAAQAANIGTDADLSYATEADDLTLVVTGDSSAPSLAEAITVGQSGSLSAADGKVLKVTDSVTVNNGSVTVSGTGIIYGAAADVDLSDTSKFTADLTVNGADSVVNLTNGGALQMDQIDINGGKVTIGGTAKSVGNAWNTAYSQLDGNDIAFADTTVAMNANSLITVKAGEFTLESGKISMAGTAFETHGVNTSKSGSAIINGTAGSELNFIGGTVEVTAGKVGEIHAPTVNLNGTTFTVNGDLKISSQLRMTSGAAVAVSDINMTAGALNVASGGELTLGDKASVISLTGGSLSNAGTVNLSGDSNIDLRGLTVQNSGTINISATADNESHVYVDSLNALVSSDGAKLSLASGDSDHFYLTVEDAENIDLEALGSGGKVAGNNNFLEADESTVTVSEAASGDAGFSVISAADLIFKGSSASGTSFTIDAGHHYEAYNSIKGFNEAFTMVNVSGALVLGDDEDPNYNASANGLNLVINSTSQDNKSFNGVQVQGGNWTGIGNVTVTSGSFAVEQNASASIAKLTTTSGAKSVVVNGTLVVNGDTSGANSVSANTVTLNAGGTMELGSTAAALVKLNASGDAVESSGGIVKGAVVFNGGTLKLDFNSDTTFDAAGLNALKDHYASGGSGSLNGFINVGEANIGLEVSGNEIAYSELKNYEGITTDAAASATATGISGNETVSNVQVGALEAVAGVTEVQIANTVQLNGVNGTYVSDANDKVIGVTSSGANTILTLAENGGQVGAITLTGDNSSLTVNAANEVSIQGSVSITSGSATVQSKTTVDGNVSVGGELVLTDELALTGDDRTVTADKLTAEGATLNKEDAVLTFGNTTNKQDNTINSSLINVDTITINSAAGQVNTLTVDGNSVVTANELNASGATIAVGSSDSSAVIEVDKLNLAGGILTIDPPYGERAAYVTVTTQTAPEDTYVGVNGSIGVGQNSVFVYGMETAEAQTLLSRLNLLDGQSLRTSLGAVAVVDKTFNIASGAALYLDSTMDHDKLVSAIGDAQSAIGTSGGAFTLGENAAIVVTEDLSEAVKGTGYVINFADADDADVDFGAGSKIIFDSGNILGGQSVNFTNAEFSTITNPTNVEITAAGGLLEGSLVSDTTDSDTNIDFKVVDGAEAILYNQSNPVKAMTLDVFGNADKYELTDNGVKYISYIGGKNGGKDIEATARMAVYAGAVQATYMAQQASTDAVADRLGIANPNSNLVYADNLQGGGIWLAPIYKNHDSDEFDAQGVDYGADIDLYGVALGADFTTDSGVRVGAYFNVGSGDADGQGVGDDVSNDFDYFGLGIYAGKTFGNFNFIADAGFTQVSNDIDQNSLAGKLTADTDTTAVTVGLRGEYKFETQFVDITPHLGVRYTNLDMDSYDAKLDGQVVATTDADNMQIFSIPFGVSFAKEFSAGEWSVKPVLDITLTANAGDTDFDQDTTFIGVDTLNLSTEVFDDFTYGGTLGVSAEYGDSLGFGINVHYVGSDAADEFGVTGNIRYMF
ncbi:MAG: autotransporter domain-containing protein [Proteobacteria bacterium]|uniref:Autotransporter domain-containing protein n=1 Tax=Candidatus Avisuccinivibrio stercorigallinarum TaxID=2840704 RepID=A0A9D9DB66_9GAMM|nr:autotransporter domain-containing protein [Candidatus Avisuccinivibrio stercorigallinarum]